MEEQLQHLEYSHNNNCDRDDSLTEGMVHLSDLVEERSEVPEHAEGSVDEEDVGGVEEEPGECVVHEVEGSERVLQDVDWVRGGLHMLNRMRKTTQDRLKTYFLSNR